MVLCALSIGCTQIFSESDCSDVLLKSVESGDGEFIANLIRRDCGATTAPATIVFLRESSATRGEGGSWGEKVYVSDVEGDIYIWWAGAEITIEAASDGEDVFLAKNYWKNIKIKYRM